MLILIIYSYQNFNTLLFPFRYNALILASFFDNKRENSKSDVSLTRLEYNTLVLLASNPDIVLTRTQIFEAVWNMDSDSCHSSVVNVICNLRKKIEPDSKKPTYIKTVLGVGYKFDMRNAGE